MDAKAEKLASYGIDYEVGIDRFAGNVAMYEKFILRFPTETHLQDLQKTFNDQDFEKCAHIAHTLKGVVGNLSFGSYYEAVTKLEEALRENNLQEAEKLKNLVEQAHQQVLEGLKELS